MQNLGNFRILLERFVLQTIADGHLENLSIAAIRYFLDSCRLFMGPQKPNCMASLGFFGSGVLHKSPSVHIVFKFLPASMRSWQFSATDAMFRWIYGYQISFAAAIMLLFQ